MILKTIFIIIAIILLVCKILPFILLQNYMFKVKVEKNEKLKKLALKFKSKNKKKTLFNIFNFITTNYVGTGGKYNSENLLKSWNPTIENILSRKQFLWCHSQNKL